MRRQGVLGILVGVLLLCHAGCGGSGEVKGRTSPDRTIERTAFFLDLLRDRLDAPDFIPAQDNALGMSAQLIREMLPFSMSNKLKSADARQRAEPLVEQLRKTFDDEVYAPLMLPEPDFARARAGIEQCVTLTGQLGDLLGG